MTRRKHRRPQRLRQPAMLIFGDMQSLKIEALIRKMALDDVLLQPPWRLEYLYLGTGFKHYRLMYDDQLVGIRDITSPKRLMAVHRGLAAYLAQCGLRPELAITMKARAETDLDVSKHRVQPLFMLAGEGRKGPRAVGSVHVYSRYFA